MNQIPSIRLSVGHVAPKNGLASAIKYAVLTFAAFAVASMFVADLSAVRADDDDDGVKSDSGGFDFLRSTKPRNEPSGDNPQTPVDSHPSHTTPNDSTPPPADNAPPPPATHPGDMPDGDGAREITEPRDGTDATTPGDETPDKPVEYFVMIRIANWGVHSRDWEDKDLAEAYAEGLKYHPEHQELLDPNTGRSILWIRVVEYTKYAAFPTQEEADAYAQRLLARHPGGRLEVKVVESDE